MKKIRRILLWLLGGLLAIACIILLGVNLYVQSLGVHHRIQQELSQRLGTPLTLRRISVTPWGGLQLNGITIPQEQGSVGGDFLQAQTFQLRVQFWSLFSDRLVIRQVALIKPEVIWAQNAAGKWRLPTFPPVARNTPLPEVVAPAGSPATVSPVPPALPSLGVSPNERRTATETAAPSTFTPEVRRVKLRDGDFTFLDSAGRVVAKFMGLNFDSSPRTAAEIVGSAQVEKISLRDRFFIEKLDSPLHYDPELLNFSSIKAEAAGGTLHGSFQMQLQAVGTPFHAVAQFDHLDAGKLVVNAGGPKGMLAGNLEGYLDATGETAESSALQGHGEIILHDGQLQQYSLLVALGQILQIDELMQLHLQQAEVHFHISPSIITIDQLLLCSPNIRLTATGTVHFDGKLHLDAQLALNDKIRRQLFTPIRENFHPVDGLPGYAAVDFHVSGTIDRPKTDLMDKVVGHDLRDLGGVISSFFGHGKKKKPAAGGAPIATPTPLPNENRTSPAPPLPEPDVTPVPTP